MINFLLADFGSIAIAGYDPADPTVYFSLGQLVSVLALLLALSQLTRPIIRFRMASRNVHMKTLIAFGGAATAFVFVSAVLPLIPGAALPLLGYPLFWEFLSALVFVVSGIYLISAISRPARFAHGNADAYLRATVAFVAKADPAGLDQLAAEIYQGIPSVVAEAQKYSAFRADLAKMKGESYEVTELTKIAHAVLDAWSDKLLCQAIVCRYPASAIRIVQCLAIAPSSRAGFALCREIVNQAFENEHSILHREESYSGLGHFRGFMKQCFGDWNFVNSDYRPLQGWSHHGSNVDTLKIERYGECLSLALESYLGSDAMWQRPESLGAACEHLTAILNSHVIKLDYMSKEDLWESKAQFSIMAVGRTLRELVEQVKRSPVQIEYTVDAAEYERYRDPTVFGVIAYAVYDCFEILATVRNHDGFVRAVCLELWIAVCGVMNEAMTPAQSEIAKRLLYHMKAKIDENLDPEERWYPSIARLVLLLIGLPGPNKVREPAKLASFYSEFFENLAVNFPLLYARDQGFAERQLPENISFDSERCVLVKRGFRGHRTELPLMGSSER
jgi:hypothetical protein